MAERRAPGIAEARAWTEAPTAFRLDQEPLRPLWTLPLRQVVHRQLIHAVLRHSALTAMAGRRLRWQAMRRAGEVTVPTRIG